jgi:hypothetical protein
VIGGIGIRLLLSLLLSLRLVIPDVSKFLRAVNKLPLGSLLLFEPLILRRKLIDGLSRQF